MGMIKSEALMAMSVSNEQRIMQIRAGPLQQAVISIDLTIKPCVLLHQRGNLLYEQKIHYRNQVMNGFIN